VAAITHSDQEIARLETELEAAQAPFAAEPLTPRVQRRRAYDADWGTGTRVAAVATVVVLLSLFAWLISAVL
jgi:hypothetical protein